MGSQEYLSKSQDKLFLNKLFDFLKDNCGMEYLKKKFGQLHVFNEISVTKSQQQETTRRDGQNY